MGLVLSKYLIIFSSISEGHKFISFGYLVLTLFQLSLYLILSFLTCIDCLIFQIFRTIYMSLKKKVKK